MVSIHAPTRGATVLSRSGIRPMVSFNPRTHTGCDKFLLVHNLFSLMFQSTHPHGVRHICTLEPLPPSGFNPRTHTGCDTIKAMRKRKRYRFQSTHPHGVRRTQIILILMCNDVSIHAPTRGATLISLGYLFAVATWFQSTHPHGVRLLVQFVFTFGNCFNPRTHTGCDYNSLHEAINKKEFQSTHPHGVRLRLKTDIVKADIVSIHAPTRGATTLEGKKIQELKFQSTHPHGVRPI